MNSRTTKENMDTFACIEGGSFPIPWSYLHFEIQYLQNGQQGLKRGVRVWPEQLVYVPPRQTRGISQLRHSHLRLSDRSKYLHDLPYFSTGDRVG